MVLRSIESFSPRQLHRPVRRRLPSWRRPPSLAADFVKHDAACPPVAGVKTGNTALRIPAEDDLGHRQCSGEGVSRGVRQRDRPETTVPDDELPALDTQVIECLQLLAEIAADEA